MVLLKYKKNTLFFCFLLPLELAGAAFALSARTVFQRLVCTVFTQISFWSHKLSERHSVGTNDAADARSTCLATPLRCTSKEAAGGDEVGPRPRCCYLLLPRSGSSRAWREGRGCWRNRNLEYLQITAPRSPANDGSRCFLFMQKKF